MRTLTTVFSAGIVFTLATILPSTVGAQTNDWWDSMSFGFERRGAVNEGWKKHEEKALRERQESLQSVTPAQEKRLSGVSQNSDARITEALSDPPLSQENYRMAEGRDDKTPLTHEDYLVQRNEARRHQDTARLQRLLATEKSADQRAMSVIEQEFQKQ